MQCWNGFLGASLLASLALAPVAPVAPVAPDQDDGVAVAARPRDAEELFARFAKLEGLEAEFHEEKHLALLVLPLESKGKLYFLPPGRLCRVVQEPKPSTLLIGPRELRVTGPGGEEVMDLGKNEAVRAFVTSLVRIFSGEREALARSYAIVYEPSAADDETWTLTLTPREKPLTEMLRLLRLDGKGSAVTAIELFEPNGDRTRTRIVRSDPKRRFTAEEKRKLFGIEETEPAKDAR